MQWTHAFVALAAVATISGCGGSSGSGPRDTPKIDVAVLGGDGRITNEGLKGRTTVLNFWASWCGPCRAETPEIARFARTHPDVNVVGIAVSDEPSASLAFAKKAGVGYRLGRDPNGTVFDSFAAPGLPATFVLDARGRIVKTRYGAVTADELERDTAATP